MKLEALAKESDDPMLSGLQDRLSDLTSKLEGRGDMLDKMVGEISTLTDNVKSLELWIVAVVQNLQGKHLSMILKSRNHGRRRNYFIVKHWIRGK